MWITVRQLSKLISHSSAKASEEYEGACFRHAVSTPLSILLSISEEVVNSKEEQTKQRYQQAINTVKQLFDEFSLAVPSSCTVDQVLQEIKVLLNTDGADIVLLSLSRVPIVLDNVPTARLKEALTCLIKNATEASLVEAGVVVVVSSQTPDTVLIDIKDYGCGISWWQQLCMYLPFVSFKKYGSGIGLYFARKVIVDELGGRLSIYSDKGMGTSISCVIPKVSSACSQSPA